MEVLRRGSRGDKVALLQRLLNKAAAREHTGGAPLRADGVFGALTEAGVRALQSRRRSLTVDGVVGTQTWQAAGLRIDHEHAHIVLLGQPTNTSCWSAAASMIVGNRSVSSGDALTGPGGGLQGSMANHEAFARSLGWRMPNVSPTPQMMADIVRRTPVWISAGGTNWAHAVVLSGVYSDGEPRGDGTMFRLHDPWPVGGGRIYYSFADPVTMFASDGVTRVPASLAYTLIPQ